MIEILDNRCRKTGPAEQLETETYKMTLARELGQQSGLFYVPQVLPVNQETASLDIEFLNGFITLSDMAITQDSRLKKALVQAGRVLALVHQQLMLSPEHRVLLPAPWNGRESDRVFIHGDYVTINVGWDSDHDSLVVLDWAAAPIVGSKATLGSPMFDVLWFVNSLFHGIVKARLFSWNAEAMACSFLNGYHEQCLGSPLDSLPRFLPALSLLQKKHLKLQAAKRSPSSAMIYAWIQGRLLSRQMRFLKRFTPDLRGVE